MKNLVTFKTAVLAKEKGFNLKVRSMYCEEKLYADTNSKGNYNDIKWVRTWRNSPDDTLSAPTQSELQKWLRDVHNIHINICALGLKKWSFMLEELSIDGTLGRGGKLGKENYSSYGDALEVGLFEALNLLP